MNMANPAMKLERQRGITLLGMLILVAFVGVFIYAGVRLTPVYVEYMNIAKGLENLKTEAGPGATTASIQRTLEKHFDIDDVRSITSKDVEVTRDGTDLQVHVAYDAYAPFIANVGFLVRFDKTVTVSGASGP
jgi:hypothetical protein